MASNGITCTGDPADDDDEDEDDDEEPESEPGA
jgi:hypothetical protein